ncbi:MAG: DegT/DnrJ/EryC1/StrS family aminotransferase [Lachnospiraceae bacterium]|nr:DegT/DnrJ/EryC1/StrS family aminotransferase [Lachnospiraceae bacterium]
MRKVQFSPPDIGQEEIQEVVAALSSGWITTGPRTKAFENRIAEYCNVNRAVCLNSATACLELILRVLGVGEGDEVITSAYTYTASASPVCHVGAKLVLVDTAKNGFEMDYAELERAISKRTKVIIPVDIAGVMCDYQRIFEIVDRNKDLFEAENDLQEAFGRIVVVADAAHSFGAERFIDECWRKSGEVADFTSFSFHAVKNLTTAEGGALTWKTIPEIDDDWLYKQFMLLSLHGQTKDALAKTKLGMWEYDIISAAYKCNMTDIMAAIGIKQLERYSELLQQRKRIVERYNNRLEQLGIEVLVHFSEQSHSSGHLYLTRVPDISEEQRNEIIVRMAEREVATNVHYKPLPMMTAYKMIGFSITDYPNAYENYRNLISLPLHTGLDEEDIEYVCDCYEKSIKEVRGY